MHWPGFGWKIMSGPPHFRAFGVHLGQAELASRDGVHRIVLDARAGLVVPDGVDFYQIDVHVTISCGNVRYHQQTKSRRPTVPVALNDFFATVGPMHCKCTPLAAPYHCS